MEVKLIDVDGESYFSVIVDEVTSFGVSEFISKAFGLNIDEYNKLLINEVIKHNDYEIEQNTYDVFYKNVTFKKNSIPDVVYLKRFRDIFVKELTLLSLGK